jgi:hypothetical protein
MDVLLMRSVFCSNLIIESFDRFEVKLGSIIGCDSLRHTEATNDSLSENFLDCS